MTDITAMTLLCGLRMLIFEQPEYNQVDSDPLGYFSESGFSLLTPFKWILVFSKSVF